MVLVQTKIKNTELNTQLLQQVLQEIQSLRQDFSIILPSEDLQEYAHPKRIKSSYHKAIKKYSPVGISK